MRPARLLAATAVAAVVVSVGASAAARPYTVEDLLARESFGRVEAEPAGARLIFERRPPYRQAARFDHDPYTAWTRSVLYLADASNNAPPRRLLAKSEGDGHQLGLWSPDGGRVLIYRLRGRAWNPGIADPATGGVRWLALAPEIETNGRTAQWRSAGELILLARPDGLPPASMQQGWRPEALLAERWAEQARGERPIRSVRDSGPLKGTDLSPPLALTVVSTDTGRSRVLATGPIRDFESAPRGRRIALLEDAGRTRDGAAPALRRVQPPRRHTLRLIGPAGDVGAPICEGADVLPNLLSWSPAGDQLLVWTRPQDMPWSSGHLTIVHGASGACERPDLGPFTADGAGDEQPSIRADWLGGAPVVLARSASGRRDWVRLADGRAIPLTGGLEEAPIRLSAIGARHLWLTTGGALWRVDLSGELTRMTPRGSVVADPWRWDPFRAPRFAINDTPRTESPAVLDGAGRLRRWMDMAGPPPTTTPADDLRAVLATGSVLVESSRRNGVETLLATLDRSAPRELATINADLADVEFAHPLSVRPGTPDGSGPTSWLYLPPYGSPDGPRHPLVVLPYPGIVRSRPPSQHAPGGDPLTQSAQLLAAAGYAVLVPGLPPQPDDHDGARMTDALTAAVDAALAQERSLDPDRIALWGHSYGGWAALVAASRSVRYRSVIASAAPTDYASVWSSFTPHDRLLTETGDALLGQAAWAEDGQGAMGGPPWSDPARYAAASPLFAADRIRTPVLLLHGDVDYVPLAQAEAMFTALLRQGRTARLVTYWGEGHALYSPANIRDMYGQVTDWLQLTLAPAARYRPEASETLKSPGLPRPAPSSPRPPPS